MPSIPVGHYCLALGKGNPSTVADIGLRLCLDFPFGVDLLTYNFGSFSLSVRVRRAVLENDSQAKLSNTQCSADGRLEYLVSGHVCAFCSHSEFFDIVDNT